MTTCRFMQSLVKSYLDERRSAGFALKIAGDQLLAFARFADQRRHRGPITEKLIFDWVQGCATRPAAITWARRLEVLLPFAKYCLRLDGKTYVPDRSLFGRAHRRLTPHIYTEGEIRDLLVAAGQLQPAGFLRPATYQTMFGLIAATGLRISEALKLRLADLDVSGSILTIRETKFTKSRLVPLHPSVCEALSSYIVFRKRVPATPNSPLFVNDVGTQLHDRTVHSVFERLRTRLGWTARGSHPAPRIHDLRHTFICRRVLVWHKQGADIDNAMLALATYVGHAKVSDTYWYLTGVPELMALAGSRFETSSSSRRTSLHG